MDFDKEMMKALELDGEKLRQMTGEDHGPFFIDEPFLEALDLLSAVTQSDGEVDAILWNQIQAFLRKVG